MRFRPRLFGAGGGSSRPPPGAVELMLTNVGLAHWRCRPSRGFLALAVTGDKTNEECPRVEIWDVPAKARLARIGGVLATSFAFSPDEKMLAVATDRGEILLFDLAEPSRAKKVLRGHTAQVLALVFSPDGTRLYSGSLDGTILI